MGNADSSTALGERFKEIKRAQRQKRGGLQAHHAADVGVLHRSLAAEGRDRVRFRGSGSERFAR